MSDILCGWLNTELRLSKSVEPSAFAKDFANGYLIGEVLHKYQLQDDFSMFMNSNTSNSKLNNFTRIEPTLQLLGVPFDLPAAQALMQEQQGAATRLLYQLYVLLQKKKKAGITGTMMETMQPAATASLHKKEKEIYSDRLHVVVKRDAELKLQKISQRYEERSQQWISRSVTVQLAQQQKQLKVVEERRKIDIEKLRESRRRQNEIVARIQASIVQMPRPPPNKSLHSLERRRQQQQQQQLRRKQQAQKVRSEIAEFEKNSKKHVTSCFASYSSSGQSLPGDLPLGSRNQGSKAGGAEVVLQSNSEYIHKIRQRLEEDAMARQQREKRRSKFLQEQLRAHEAQEVALREEQLVERLTRQSQQERRLAVQLLQMRMQKEAIRQNRVVRERQYQQQRERDFQEALEREAALVQQAKLDRSEEIRKETELHDRLAAERAQNKYRKHFKNCREVLEQIVDLATKAGEYRLLTGNLIPVKLMSEWKELFLSGLSLYEDERSAYEPSGPADPVELERQEILNSQDYDEYTNMVGEWSWPEEAGEVKSPPVNNRILGHIVQRLRSIVCPPTTLAPPPPSFPHSTLKACVLGKAFSGKTTCLAKIAQVHGIHVLSANTLIQEALASFQNGEEVPDSSELHSNNQEETKKRKLSLRALRGEAIDKVLRDGKAIPDEILVDVMVEAIKQVPAHSGWILDGFPVDINQARLLERALGGSADVEDGAAKKRRGRTNLAIVPGEPKEPPPPSPVLDLALLLNVSDTCVLHRAAKHTGVEESVPRGGQDPVEGSPPDSNRNAVTVTATTPVTDSSGPVTTTAASDTSTHTDIAASNVPPCDEGLEKGQVQHRITSFQDTWSKLEKWFGRKQSVLVHLEADVDEVELYRRMESVLQETMKQKQKRIIDPASFMGLTESSSTLLQDPAFIIKSGLKSSTHSPRGSKRTSICSDSQEAPRSPPECGPPRPGSANWVYVDEPLPPEMAEYLCPCWDTVCESYVSNIKAVMHKLRSEHILIIHHLFNIREEYKHYLGRPDLKQEFVSHWQKDYNSVPDDMRDDHDAKAELHQRLDDLVERLWDICDKRREQTDQEKDALRGDGWLDDHTAILINHYSSLMQTEVDRFQDTLGILRDYYLAMYRQALTEVPSEFSCLPLLDITDTQETPQEESTERVDDVEENKRKTKVVPLIPRRPPSPEVNTKQKGLQQPEVVDMPPEEKLISNIYQAALTAITNLVSVEAEWEVREENQGQMQQERLEEKKKKVPRTSESAAAKNKKRSSGKKKAPPTPPPDPSPPPAIEESLEEIQRREVRNKIHSEYTAAMEHEEHAVQLRIELLRGCVLKTVCSLQRRAQQEFNSMEEGLAARYLAEMNCIDQIAQVVRNHIESGTKLQNDLVLVCTDFYLNGDLRVVADSPPPPRPDPLEKPTHSTLTVDQLRALYRQLHSMAPSGLMSSAEFTSVLQDIISLNMASGSLPEPWINMDETQLMEMVSLLSRDSELLNWHRFLLSAALPWPLPSLTQLLSVLQRFQAVDTDATGYITQEQYLQTELWFPSESVQPVPEDPSEPLPYDRLDNLRKFLFQLFANHSMCPPGLDYVSMLQQLAAHPDPSSGFIRALSVVLGQHLKHPSTSKLVKSIPNIEEVTELGSPEPEGEEGEAPCGVSIPALLTVLCQNGPKAAGDSAFHQGSKSQEEHTEELAGIFGELGYTPEDAVPFSVFSQYPSAQNLIEGCQRYQLIDIHRVLRVTQSEEETQSSTAS